MEAQDTNADFSQRIGSLMKRVDLEVQSLLRSWEKQRDRMTDVDVKLGKMNDGLAMLGADPQRNIDILVESVAAILDAPTSLYNRLDDEGEMLCTWSIFNPPADYVREDPATGHICFEATMKTDHRPVVLEDLSGTIWEQTDGVVKKYGLKSYLGFPVRHRGRVVGSLCMVDTKPRRFTSTDILVVNALAKAMSIEEERKATERELEEKLALVDRQADELRTLRR